MRSLAILFAGIFGTSVAQAEASGYLARVGPPTLRFQAPLSAIVRMPLPPLQMTDPVATPSHPPVENPIAIATSSEAPAPVTETGESPLAPAESPGTNVTGPAAPVELQSAAGVISPQMLLRFFLSTEPGSSSEAVIVTPPSFTPARPASPGASSATYNSPKR